MKTLYFSAVALLFMMLVCINFNSCEYFDDDDDGTNEQPLLAVIPQEIQGFNELVGTEFPDNTFISDAEIPGGFSIREWWTADDRQFVLAAVLDFQTPLEAVKEFNKIGPVKGIRSFELADTAVIGSQKLNTGLTGFRVLIFLKDQFVVVTGSGTVDSTLSSPDSSVVINLAQQINTSIGNSDLKSFPAVPSGYHDRTSNRSYLFDDGPALKDAEGSVTKNTKLSYKGDSVGYVTMSFIRAPGNPCGSCPNSMEYCLDQDIEVRLKLMFLNEDADDTDNFLDGQADAVVGGWVFIKYYCDEPVIDTIFFIKAELGDITNNRTLKLDYFIKRSLGCQCPLYDLRVSYDVWLKDDDTNSILEWLTAIEQVIQAWKPAALPLKQQMQRKVNLPVTTPDPGQDPFGSVPQNEIEDLADAHETNLVIP